MFKPANFIKLLFSLLLMSISHPCALLATSYQATSASYLDILDELEGFGRNTTGGKDGKVVVVTNLNDRGAGSLREAVSLPGPKWVVFREGLRGTIKLRSNLEVTGDKTVDGRGADITLAKGTVVIRTDNVILTHLKFSGADDDAVRILGASKNVWIHHNSLSKAGDGLVDVIEGSRDITISWNTFRNHTKTMLLGHDQVAGDEVITVSLHHNVFKGTGERNPKLNRGKVHSYNNYIARWRYVGAYVEAGGEIYSEANIYKAGRDKDASNYEDEDPGFLKSVGDRLENGARHRLTEAERVFEPATFYSYRAERADGQLRAKLNAQAGWQPVPVPLDVALELGETSVALTSEESI